MQLLHGTGPPDAAFARGHQLRLVATVARRGLDVGLRNHLYVYIRESGFSQKARVHIGLSHPLHGEGRKRNRVPLDGYGL